MSNLSAYETSLHKISMTDFHKHLLIVRRLDIIRDIMITEEFLSVLRQDNILSENMKEEIDARLTKTAKAGYLLDRLEKRTELAYYRFILALLETKQSALVGQIDKTHPLYVAFLKKEDQHC